MRFRPPVRTTVRVFLLPLAVGLFGGAGCASLWGFETLSVGADGGVEGGGGDASQDATRPPDGAPDAPSCMDGCSQGTDSGAPGDGSEGGGSGLTCLSSGGNCSCTVNPPGNGQPCSPSSLGVDPSAVVCCADPSYPQTGMCTCFSIGCSTSNGDCICAPGNGQPGGSCEAGAWTCCVQTSAPGCLCASISCQVGYEPLDAGTCGPSDLLCGGAQRPRASCN